MQLSKHRGFTIVELMISLVLCSLLATALYKVVIRQARTVGNEVQSTQNSRASQQLRELLADDIAQAGYDTQAALVPIRTAGKFTLVLQGDFNTNGGIEETPTPESTPEVITYAYQNKQVTRNDGRTIQILLPGVKSFSFTYLKADKTELKTTDALSAVRQVEARWKLETGTRVRSGEPVGEEYLKATIRNYHGP